MALAHAASDVLVVFLVLAIIAAALAISLAVWTATR